MVIKSIGKSAKKFAFQLFSIILISYNRNKISFYYFICPYIMSLHTMKKTLIITLTTAIFGIIGTVAMSSVSAQNVGTVGWGWSFLNNGADRASGIDVAGAWTATGEAGLMSVITKAINWALWIIMFIVFAYLLYGGFKMITSAGEDDAYQEWLKILKNAAIGVAFIAVSWLLVQFVFAIIGMITG